MVWGWGELVHIDRGTTCVCKGEREREREKQEKRINTQFEQCHNLGQLICSPLMLISVGPGELLSDRTGEEESEEKESLL